jgi:hypothetical protein
MGAGRRSKSRASLNCGSTAACVDEALIAACDWRVGSYCWRCVAEQLRAGTGPRSPDLAELLARIPVTPAGVEKLGCSAASGLRCRYAPTAPRYVHQLHELWVGDVFLHRFPEGICNQVAILLAFQQSGWRRWVIEPLGPLGKTTLERYGAWLKDAVFRLNRCQRTCLIRFRSQPRDRSVSWEFALNSATARLPAKEDCY